jgi:DNA-binding transcriptional LysR family regulator
MQIASLHYLLAVSNAGSFSAAARQLSVHTSTLSRHVFELEEELGTTIFERRHSGVRLTSNGHEILIYARQALANVDALTKIARSGGIGKQSRIRIGVYIPPISKCLRELLSRWNHVHHEVELSLHELPDNDIFKAIRDGQLDVALVAEHAIPPDLAWEPIHGERLLVAVESSCSLCRDAPISWSMLRKASVLVQDWPQSHLTIAFYGGLIGYGTHFQPHAASKQSILALVAAGFGISLVTESQADVGFPGVSFVPICEENAFINVAFAWMPQSEDPTIGRFIAFMRDEARSLRSR